MAKKQPAPDYDLPTLDDEQEELEEQQEELEEQQEATGEESEQIATLVELVDPLPVGDIDPDSYLTRHVEVQLDHHQATTLKRLFVGLDHAGTRLLNGRRVSSHADVVRYLLEQLTPMEGDE